MAAEGAASSSSHTSQHTSQTAETTRPLGHVPSRDTSETEQKGQGLRHAENDDSPSESGNERPDLEAAANLCDVPLIFIHGMKGCTLVHKKTQECAWLKGNMAVSSSFSPLSLELPLGIKDGVQVCVL